MATRNRPLFNSRTAAMSGTSGAIEGLVPYDGTPEQRKEAKDCVLRLIESYGDVVDGYPLWHPLMGGESLKTSYAITNGNQYTFPSQRNGYDGLDHTICFRNAFVSCPYRGAGGADKLIKSVENLPKTDVATITAERLLEPLYATGGESIEDKPITAADPILVVCNWNERHYPDASGMVPKRTALGLMVADAVRNWENAQCGEPWEYMMGCMLGSPHGEVSSLFVDMETGRAIKKLFNTINDVGLFGAVRDD